MDYLQNHIWCSESNWDGIRYDCRHMVTILRWVDGYENDWNNTIDEDAESFINEDNIPPIPVWYSSSDKERVRESCRRKSPNLKPRILKWLHDNVKDRTGEECNKGWCVGSAHYRGTNGVGSFNVFFHRKNDAMKFVNAFSEHKKPINYCQYFSDVRKTLNLETLKYEIN